MKPRTALAILLGVVVLGGAIAAITWRQSGGRSVWHQITGGGSGANEADPYGTEQIRGVVLSYLSQPFNSGKEFARQVLGEANLELYDVRQQALYLSVPRDEAEAGIRKSTAEQILIDPANLRLAEPANGRLKLDDYSMHQLLDRWHLLATPADNLKVDPAATLRFPFKRAAYTVSLRETADFLRGESLVGGLLHAVTDEVLDDKVAVLANHGAFVAAPGEPSLHRFAHDLVRDLPPGEEGREQRVQRLLDFVTEEIAYSTAEGTATVELMKRPNETLMTREGDCSNKVILFASLLGQIGERPLLVYAKRHIGVAIPQGRFTDQNGLTVSWKDARWVIAETTVSGFRIGRTTLSDDELKSIKLLQPAHQPNTIVALKSGKPVSFR